MNKIYYCLDSIIPFIIQFFDTYFPKWVKMYYFIGVLPFYFCILLTYPEKLSIFTIPFELVSMYCHYYFFHRLLHIFPDFPLNLHTQVHHIKLYEIDRSWELFIDFLFEMFCFCGLPLIIQHYIGYRIFSPSVVIMITLTMTFGHIINYSIFGSNEIHQTHHRNTNFHYGPDFMDHLFGTAINDHEDGNMHIMPIIMATCFTLILKIIFKWKD